MSIQVKKCTEFDIIELKKQGIMEILVFYSDKSIVTALTERRLPGILADQLRELRSFDGRHEAKKPTGEAVAILWDGINVESTTIVTFDLPLKRYENTSDLRFYSNSSAPFCQFDERWILLSQEALTNAIKKCKISLESVIEQANFLFNIVEDEFVSLEWEGEKKARIHFYIEAYAVRWRKMQNLHGFREYVTENQPSEILLFKNKSAIAKAVAEGRVSEEIGEKLNRMALPYPENIYACILRGIKRDGSDIIVSIQVKTPELAPGYRGGIH